MIIVGVRAQDRILGLGPWALSEGINRFEEKLLMIRNSQTKTYKWRANEWLSEEYILLGLSEYGSKYITKVAC